MTLQTYLINSINNGASNDTITYDGVTIPVNYLQIYAQYTDLVRVQDQTAARTFSIDPTVTALGQYTNADYIAISNMLANKQQAYFDAYFPILAQITAATITTNAQIDTALAAFVSAYTPTAGVTNIYSTMQSLQSSITAMASNVSSLSTAMTALPPIPTAVSQLPNDAHYATATDVATAVSNLVNGAGPAVDTLGEIAALLASDESAAAALATLVASKADASAMTTALALKANTSAIPSVARTVSALTGALVSANNAANGTQAHATKAASIRATVGLSSTVNVVSATAAASQVIAEVCATNSVTPTDWVYAGEAKLAQTVSLAIALGLVQADNRQINFDVPAGYYYRLRNVGTGTHAETFIGGQMTVYG